MLLAQTGESTPPDGQILSVGLLGAASMACFVADAFVSADEANHLPGHAPRLASTAKIGGLVPYLARDRGNPERTVSGLALVGVF